MENTNHNSLYGWDAPRHTGFMHWLRHLQRRPAMWLCALTAWLMGAVGAFICFHASSAAATDDQVQGAVLCTAWFGAAAFTAMPVARALMGELWSRRTGLVLGLLLGVMFVGIAVNIGYFTAPPGGWEQPYLVPWSDSGREYSIAVASALGEELPFSNSYGYPLILGAIMRLFGPSLIAPLMLSALSMFAACAAAGAIGAVLLPQLRRRKTAMWGCLLFALVPSVPYYGTMLLKEGPLTLSFALCALMLADTYMGRFRVRSAVAGALGAFGLMAMRSPMGWCLLLGTALVFVRQYYLHRSLTPSLTRGTLCSLLLCMAVLAGGREFRSAPDFALMRQAPDHGTMLGYGKAGRYGTEMIPGYFEETPLQRTARLPVSCVAQWMPPFPWHWTRDAALGPFAWWAHMSWFWYAVGGLGLGWFALCAWRRGASGGLAWWGAWWALCYIGTAYASGGTVARYALPYLPLLVPLALQAAGAVRHDRVPVRQACIYAGVYSLLIAAALIASHSYLEA